MDSFKVALAVVFIGVAHGCTVKIDATVNERGIWESQCSMDCNMKPSGYMSTEVMNGYKAYFESEELTEEGFMACMTYNDKAITQCVISPLGDRTSAGACAVADQEYPEEFTKIGKNYFYMTNTPLAYNAGKEECAKHNNSMMARVMNQAENDAIAAFIPKEDPILGVMIGANDIDTEDEFYFTGADGESSLKLEWTNWNGAEPNNVRNEDCVVLKANKGFRWIDTSCSNTKFPALCQWTRPVMMA